MEIKVNYAKLDYVISEAEIVIVGISPGPNQMKNMLDNPMLNKKKNAFAGYIRKNLICMLNHIGINKLLRIDSCESLWKEDFGKAEFTSLLKDSVTKDGKPISKADDIDKYEELKQMFMDGFVKDISCYSKAKLYIALGPQVYKKLLSLKEEGVITAEIIALSHPSNNNADRWKYYVGEESDSLKWAKEQSNKSITIINNMIEANV